MGGQSSSTPQNMGSPLSNLFASNTGYQANAQPQAQLPTIQAPQYGPMLNPSPQQAAAATAARMQARTPVVSQAAPATAPKVVERRFGREG